ncbi:hypothetical protein [Arthrobacter sp. AL12]|uniref:hypothetical protein n=1 Tax=Arthrobacter sp. AL12 TaxID=3042241 RepID=UPI00249C8D3F|nr:hypothetical protein [Arthrobacter sp. AL12]MDI3210826.1 hypothetical protein [Arthrobacter sp. AL12]
MRLPARTASGAFYLPKPGWAHLRGRSLDALVVMVAAGVLMVVLNAMVQNLALGPLAFALLDSEGLFAAALGAIWFDAAAGMLSVRISDGTTAGAWLGAGVPPVGPLHRPIWSWRLPQRSTAGAGTVSRRISSPLTAVPGWQEAPPP